MVTICPHCGKALLSKAQADLMELIRKKFGHSDIFCKYIRDKLKISAPLLSYHLRKLCKAGLLCYNPQTGKLRMKEDLKSSEKYQPNYPHQEAIA